ncbi:MAG: 16S rRNA (cytidine(1402)-2'-O)-methyltransferase [Legionellales bacterium]|nr:16S rRNA (cytidine(1402)-2'-O)-methyltransferase [Legionellales bacterium]
MQIGKLFVVATPIGNLDDITIRAIDILKKVDLIFAEDTRCTKKLLSHLGININLQSLNAHNEFAKKDHILHILEQGKDVALVADAGTPLVSDPGGTVISFLKERGVQIVPIPGPCALTCALSASGYITKGFIFEGFLSSKQSSRKKELLVLRDEKKILVFYEAPHRLLYTLIDMQNIFGKDRKITLAKELTKIHEKIIDGSIFDIISWLEEDELRKKGEFVIIVYPGYENNAEKENSRLILKSLLEKLSLRDAVDVAHEITDEGKNKLYNLAKELKR